MQSRSKLPAPVYSFGVSRRRPSVQVQNFVQAAWSPGVDASRSRLPAPISFLDATGLEDYLRQDHRPTFAIDLTSDIHGDLEIIFANQAFQDADGLTDAVVTTTWRRPCFHKSDPLVAAFALWARCETRNNGFRFRHILWTFTTISGRWRVVNGISLDRLDEPTNSHSKPVQAVPLRSASSEVDRPIHQHEAEENPGPAEATTSSTLSTIPSSRHNQLILTFDWSSTPLGPLHEWPQVLVQMMSFLLCHPEALVIFWGKERTIIYNEPYKSIVRKLHPAIGKSAPVVFASFWDLQFEPVAQEVELTGLALLHEDVRIVMDREGILEETFFTYAFTPIRGADGTVCGILNEAIETTKQHVVERRMSTLLRLAEGTARMTLLSKFWARLFASMPGGEAELPFVALYSTGEALKPHDTSSDTSSGYRSGDKLYLEGSFGFSDKHAAVPDVIDMRQPAGIASAIHACMEIGSRAMVFDRRNIENSTEFFESCLDRGFGVEYKQVVVCPLRLSSTQATAWLILGINPLLRYDYDYQRFVELLCRQIEDAGTSVTLLEREKRRLQKTVESAEHQRQWLSNQLQQQTREAEESELRFFNFAKQAPVGVFIYDADGRVKYANEAWYNLLDVSPSEPAAFLWRPRIHPEDLEEVDEIWRRLTSGQPHVNFECRVLRENLTGDESKDVVYLNVCAFAEYADDGSAKSVSGILSDVSLLKAHEREAEIRLSEALEAKRAQENFMDMVSHEMRNPLNAILQCAEEASLSLQQFKLGGDRQYYDAIAFTTAMEAIDTVSYCGQHQKQIIDDVLTISKLDSDLITLWPAETLPSTVVEKAFKIFASEIRASGIKVSSNLSSDRVDHDRTPVFIDSSRVLQILINLIGNSVKFLKDRTLKRLHVNVTVVKTKPSPPEVRFIPSHRTRKGPAGQIDWGKGTEVYVYFSVEDSGPGLTPEETDSLFARFRQASPRTHAQYGGSGLGLFISRELAELHGGEIGLTSQLNKGSTFAFYVKGRAALPEPAAGNGTTAPKAEAVLQSQDAKPGTTTANTTPASEITILIVEDNLVNQKVLNRQLRKLGYKTITANHGAEALQAVQQSTSWLANSEAGSEPLSVILCDLEMPVMDGLTCVRQIRRWQDEGLLDDYVPVVAVTGNARTEQISAAKEAGFDDVVCKPYSVPDLVPLIRRLVGATSERGRGNITAVEGSVGRSTTA